MGSITARIPIDRNVWNAPVRSAVTFGGGESGFFPYFPMSRAMYGPKPKMLVGNQSPPVAMCSQSNPA